MSDIRLFVCCHKPSKVPGHELLFPLQVGTELSDTAFPGFFHDNEGESISGKNRTYCELTGLYWMWKNVTADYYGLFHYRRYLYPDPAAERPYFFAGPPSEKLLEELHFDRLREMIGQNDLVVPLPESMRMSAKEYYARSFNHYRKDIELAERIVGEMHPEYSRATSEYLSGEDQIFMNIAVMSREVLNDYCAFLFPVLEEYDRRADRSGYNEQEMRVDGYLGEYLLGIFTTYQKKNLRTLHLPRVHFVEDPKELAKNRTINGILPPGSRRRAFVKQHIMHGYKS